MVNRLAGISVLIACKYLQEMKVLVPTHFLVEAIKIIFDESAQICNLIISDISSGPTATIKHLLSKKILDFFDPHLSNAMFIEIWHNKLI